MPEHTLHVETVALTDIHVHTRNPRRGDLTPIAESLDTNGQYRPLVVARDGTILAGNHTYQAIQRLGWPEVKITRLDVDPDSAEAMRIMLADNRTSDLGTYDDALLLSLIEEQPDLLGTGYDAAAIEHLRHLIDGYDGHADYLDEHRHRPAARRALPVRASISLAGGNKDHVAAIRIMGFEFGLISTTVDRYFNSMRVQMPQHLAGIRIAFLDNPWHDYDHAGHLSACERVRPVAATTRDIMTKQQCVEAGVAYYTLDQTVAMAEEVAEFVDEVILIPKFDCMADLPREVAGKRIVLGYSVPSSYGATPVDPLRFLGWPIHLLGGSWPRQRALLHLLGEDVVSLDHNYMLKMSKFGCFWQPPNYVTRQVQDLGFVNVRQRGLNYVAFILSLLAIATDLSEWNGPLTDDQSLGEIAEGDEDVIPVRPGSAEDEPIPVEP